jgi:hypothetical protein
LLQQINFGDFKFTRCLVGAVSVPATPVGIVLGDIGSGVLSGKRQLKNNQGLEDN